MTDGGFYGNSSTKNSAKPKPYLPDDEDFNKITNETSSNNILVNLCCNTKMTGLKKNMKKIMKLPMYKKMKDIAKKFSRKSIWFAFGGIDGLNLCISNTRLHNSFFDVTLISIGDDIDLIPYLKEARKEICGFFNVHTMRIINSAESVFVRDLNKTLGILKGSSRFSSDAPIVDGRTTIDMMYIEDEKVKYTPFIVFRCMKKSDYKTICDPLDFEGIKTMSISNIYMEAYRKFDDISHKLRREASHLEYNEREKLKVEFNNWKLRKSQITKLLHQDTLTLSCIAIEKLARRCYPCLELDNDIYVDRVKFLQVEEQTLAIGKETSGNIFKSYELAESSKKSSREELDLTETLERARNSGFLPDDRIMLKSLKNEFNDDLLFEVRQTIIGDL